jgi:hypothetical protein
MAHSVRSNFMVAANANYHSHLYAPDIGITQTPANDEHTQKSQP